MSQNPKPKETLEAKTKRLKALRLEHEKQNPKLISTPNYMIQSQLKLHGLNSEISFGKYKNKTIQEILDQDPDYIKWALENIIHFHLDEEAYEEFHIKSNQYLPPKAWESPR